MAFATARIGVDLIDQLAHGMHAVTHHQRRLTPCGRHEFVTHHQQAVVVAGQEFLDHHGAVALGRLVRRLECIPVGDVDRDTLALVAVLGFDHDRQTDFLGNCPGLLG